MTTFRPARRKRRGGLLSECLEARSLLSGVGAGLADVLRELGPVSVAAAHRGVEATATIDAGAAVTFRFEVEAGGSYTLFVRHDGAGLTLEAQTPAGTAAIDPGPAGPFQAVRLDLGPGTYEITAAARGGQPVFVDWELLLNSGVGQAAATTVGSVVPSVAIPLSSGSASLAPIAAGDSMPTLGSAEASPSAGAGMALALAPSAGPMRYSAGGPVGRLSAGSPAPVPDAVPAPEATEGLASGTLATLDAALLVGIVPVAGHSGFGVAAQAEPSWLDDLARSITGSHPVEPVAEGGAWSVDPMPVAAELPAEAAADEDVSLTSISPGVLLVGVVATAASRRLGRQAHPSSRQPWASGSPHLGRTLVRPRSARGRSPRVKLARPGQPLSPPGIRNPRS